MATWKILEIAVKYNYVTENVFLAAEDLFEKDPFLKPGEEDQKLMEPTPQTKLKIEKLSADLRPSIDLLQFWKGPLIREQWLKSDSPNFMGIPMFFNFPFLIFPFNSISQNIFKVFFSCQ